MKHWRPVILDEKDREWIIEHFKHTKNDEIAARFGISLEWLHRFARQHGLKKSRAFMKKCQLATAAAAKASHLRNGTYPPKGRQIPNAYRWPVGHKEDPKTKARRLAKSRESRNRTLEAEYLRYCLGEPQKTKIRFGTDSPRRISLRYQLRKRGYIISRGSNVAYYDENTNRSLKIENRKKGDRYYVYMEYKPIEEYEN